MIGNARDRKFDVVGVFVLEDEELWKAVEEYIEIDEAVRDISEEALFLCGQSEPKVPTNDLLFAGLRDGLP
jgi:hypothetical protein